jgi:hypothetical protein
VHAAHPLNTEDTGTQGKGGWQLEVNGERNNDEGVRGAQAAVVLSHGVAGSVDLQVGLPWQNNGADRGPGDVFAAVKWRFWEKEKDPLSFGLRAGVFAPTGDDTRGLGNGRANWAALLIGQYEGERWIFLAHVGYRHNANTLGDRDSISEVSAAVLYKMGNVKLLLDANRTTNADPRSGRIQQAVAGAIWSIGEKLDLDAGYRVGNDPALDRALMLGVTLRW